jgi:hypothetical protein
MARAATYEDLRTEGEALRRRLARKSLTGPAIDVLVRDVRLWQLRCAVAIAVRSPRLVAPFRTRAGALQELAGHGWTPVAGWQASLALLIATWMAALDWADGPGAEG